MEAQRRRSLLCWPLCVLPLLELSSGLPTLEGAGWLGAPCPVGSVQVATLQNYTVCEELGSLNGSFVYLPRVAGLSAVTLRKRVYPQSKPGNWYGFTQDNVTSAEEDLIGNAMVSTGSDPDYSEVLAALPPILAGWGAKADYRGQHTFTKSRGSSVDIVLDHVGDSGSWSGYPRPTHVLGDEYKLDDVHEGLVGSDLPIPHFVYVVNATLRWEMTVAPNPDMGENREQAAMFRFARIVSGNTLSKEVVFDTYMYAPELQPNASDFYQTLLDQHEYWAKTWANEGLAEMRLPGEVGQMLVDQARHALVKDMITRVRIDWPRYGVCSGEGGCSYGDPKSNGFQETFTASLAASLELGAFTYARRVVENYLRFYLRGRTGLVFYRGFEMAQAPRALALLAQYVRATGDGDTVVRYFDKIQGIVELLRRRRAAALRLPTDHAAYGLPIGNDEADLFRITVDPKVPTSTEMPFYSIAAEMYRGFNDLGRVWLDLAPSLGRPDMAAEGQAMLNESSLLLVDLNRSLHRSMVSTGQSASPRCWPYVAGAGVCDEVKPQPSNRDSEPWRTYAEMLWSAALPREVVDDIYQWNRRNRKMMRLGVLSGTGSDCCGNFLMSFTSHGWGYGLLRNDLVEAYLLNLFTMSAHSQTRGTWTAPEEATITGSGMPYCPPSQLAMPLFLKWAFVWDSPDDESLWLGRAAPRCFVGHADGFELLRSPTRWGRVSFGVRLVGQEASVNVSAPLKWLASPPKGGLYLRLRAPKSTGRIGTAQAGGRPVPKEWIDAAQETIHFPGAALRSPDMLRSLESLRVQFLAAPAAPAPAPGNVVV